MPAAVDKIVDAIKREHPDYPEDKVWAAHLYLLTNLDTNKLYVGVTKQNIKRRLRDHCKNAYLKNTDGLWKFNYKMARAIRKYGLENFKCELIDLGRISDTTLFLIEKRVIEQLDTFHNGYNSSVGGENGACGWNSRPVYQYDLDGTFIKKHNSVLSAANYLNRNDALIGRVVDKNKTAYGFQWRSHLTKLDVYNSQKGKDNIRRVEQVDNNGKIINTFNSFTEAEKTVGISRGLISNSIKRKGNCGGYIWRQVYA